jgi:restriction system protein
VLGNQSNERIGVQVKRYRHGIKVEQIRSFVGALLVGNYVKGMFVTTSRYQSGCRLVAQHASAIGISIELLDERSLFDAIGVAQIHGTDPVPSVLETLRSDTNPERHFVLEVHRNSL